MQKTAKATTHKKQLQKQSKNTLNACTQTERKKHKTNKTQLKNKNYKNIVNN